MSLPSGFKKLEYIQPSGTQYIDTGFKPNNNTKVVIDFELTENTGKHQIIFGARSSSNSEQYVLGFTGHRSPAVWRSDFGSNQVTFSSNLNWSGNHNATKNGNICTLDAESVTNTASTFESTVNLLICAGNTGGNVDNYTKAKVYFCKIYDNGTLARDFIPCKNASGVVGMWDDVNSVFYGNAGSGTFTAGPEVAGSNRVLVDAKGYDAKSVFYGNAGSGTFTAGPEVAGSNRVLVDAKGYDAKSGTVLINGMVYHLKKGRGLLNGMGYDIPFVGSIPLSELTTGTILYINESGSPVPFYVAKHDYESGLNGAGRTLVVRKDCYNLQQFNDYNSINNEYANSLLDNLLCNTYLNLLGSGIRAAIGTTKFYYTPGNITWDMTTLQRAVFQLSLTEYGLSIYVCNVEGSALPIASALQIAYLDGSAVQQWTRSPGRSDASSLAIVTNAGAVGSQTYNFIAGSRPAFTLPATLEVQDNGDGTYSLAE